MATIPELPASTSLASTDLFIKSQGGETQKITAPDLASGLMNQLPTAVPIGKGGTGATSKDAALANLGIHKAYVSTAGLTITLPNSYRGILYITDSSPANNGEFAVWTNTSGTSSYTPIKSASNVTLTTGSNTLTVTPASGARNIMLIDINNAATF